MAQPVTSSVDRRWMVLVLVAVAIAQLMVVLDLILGWVLTQYLSWRWTLYVDLGARRARRGRRPGLYPQ